MTLGRMAAGSPPMTYNVIPLFCTHSSLGRNSKHWVGTYAEQRNPAAAAGEPGLGKCCLACGWG